MKVAIEHQHQCHGVFRHGIRRVGRDTDDVNPVLLARFQIDIIETGASQRDQLDTEHCQGFHDLRITPVVDEDAHRLTSLRGMDRFGAQRNGNVVKRMPVAIAAIE